VHPQRAKIVASPNTNIQGTRKSHSLQFHIAVKRWLSHMQAYVLMVETSIPIPVPNFITMYQLSTFFWQKCAPLVHCDEIGDRDGNGCPHLTHWPSSTPAHELQVNFQFETRVECCVCLCTFNYSVGTTSLSPAFFLFLKHGRFPITCF